MVNMIVWNLKKKSGKSSNSDELCSENKLLHAIQNFAIIILTEFILVKGAKEIELYFFLPFLEAWNRVHDLAQSFFQT